MSSDTRPDIEGLREAAASMYSGKVAGINLATVLALCDYVECLEADLEKWERRAPAEAAHLRDAREKCERLTAENEDLQTYADDYERWAALQKEAREALGAARENTAEAARRVVSQRDGALATVARLTEALEWACDDYEAERGRQEFGVPISVVSARRVLAGEKVKPRNEQTREHFAALLTPEAPPTERTRDDGQDE